MRIDHRSKTGLARRGQAFHFVECFDMVFLRPHPFSFLGRR